MLYIIIVGEKYQLSSVACKHYWKQICTLHIKMHAYGNEGLMLVCKKKKRRKNKPGKTSTTWSLQSAD